MEHRIQAVVTRGRWCALWGAEAWQIADLYMPDDPSPFQKDEGIPCVMLIHGGFWKEQYTLDLMQPIAEDLAEAGGWTPSPMC